MPHAAEVEPTRDAKGRWLPGVSGHRVSPWAERMRQLRDAFLQHATDDDQTELYSILLKWARNEDPKVSIPACDVLLQRTQGRPPTELKIEAHTTTASFDLSALPLPALQKVMGIIETHTPAALPAAETV